MIPGEIKVKSTEIEINKHHPETVKKNTGDRPIKLVLIFISLKLIKL